MKYDSLEAGIQTIINHYSWMAGTTSAKTKAAIYSEIKRTLEMELKTWQHHQKGHSEPFKGYNPVCHYCKGD